jgi:Cof subfamily protein (haloacid dehalogenase superfamily)
MMEKLYVSDLDGTLLRNDATLSDYSAGKLNELLQNGIHFTVASARSISSMQHMLRDIDFNLPVIEFNGAFISDLKTGKHEIINEIDRSIVKEIYSLTKSCQCVPFVSTFNGHEDRLYYDFTINAGMDWYKNDRVAMKDKRLRNCMKLEESFNDHVICFTIIDKRPILEKLRAEIQQTFAETVEIHLFENQYSPGWYWLTVHDYRSTKDQAIELLMERIGIDRKKLIVFGDNSNDIKMFKIANEAIAVENATDELKQYATKIIGTNEEDSVVKFILNEFIGKRETKQHG